MYLKEIKTIFKGAFEEDGRCTIMINDNICYPHGGGQKGDRGVLIIEGEEYIVLDTIKDKYSDEGVLLITKSLIPEDKKGKEIIFKLDWNFRYVQMRLHTAVHFHHCMMEKVAGKTISPPKTSDIQEGFAFNRYSKGEVTQGLIEKANVEFLKAVEAGADVKTYPDTNKKGFRWWECLGYKIPCGGTHVANIKEIGEVDFNFSTKKGKPTVNIALKS